MESYLHILQQGIVLGLFLAILVGPLLVAIVHAGIEGGKKAGFLVASGIWVSDFSIVVVLFLLKDVLAQILDHSFLYIFGFAGAIILFFMAWKNLKSNGIELKDRPEKSYKWLTGFLINTINPFTFFFWSGVILYSLIEKKYSSGQLTFLLATIFSVIVFTDTMKVVFAGYLQKKFDQGILKKIRFASGIAFLIFGIILLWKVFNTNPDPGFMKSYPY